MSITKDGSSELRFEFGANWASFLLVVDDERIQIAQDYLSEMLGCERLDGVSFVDVGSGSGLMSLAAWRLGAEVRSFDYDPQAVACTRELRRRFADDQAERWQIEQGSALDPGYLQTLGQYDIVYSWGVLHHTGDMWSALENVVVLTKPESLLYIAIYNDQGLQSRIWTRIKRWYNASPRWLRPVIVVFVGMYFEGRAAAGRVLKAHPRNPLPFADWAKKKQSRGMSVWHDLVDWAGGYPFEVAKPDQIFDFYRERGFSLVRLKTAGGGHGCNEYVFARRR